MNKQEDHAFGKDVYLLGKDADGIKYWLEAPKWDCGWYWGFGYIETYRSNRKPSVAVDISSHTHADGDYGNSSYTKKYGRTDLFTDGFLVDATFTEKEGWTLRELFATFYQLRKEAEFYNRGKSHIADSPLDFKDEARAKLVNETMIPKVTDAILEILTPEKGLK